MLKEIHESALVHESAEIGEGSIIGPNVVVGKGAKIGKKSKLMAHIVIEDYAVVGEQSLIYPFVSVAHHCIVGDNTTLLPHTNIGSHGFGYATDKQYQHHYIPQIGIAHIGNDSKLGPHTDIDRAALNKTSVGDHSYIGPYSHLAHNVEIGKHTKAMQGLVIAGSTKVGDHFTSYGKSAITGHKLVADHISLRPFTGMNNGETKPGTYQGFPHQPLTEFQDKLAVIEKLNELTEKMEQRK